MRIRILSIAFISLFSTLTFAQSFEWAAQQNGDGYGIAFETEIDSDGNVYAIGTFEGTVDFDPGPGTFPVTSQGVDDIYIEKLDPSGNLVWVKSIGGSSLDQAYSIEIDANNDLFIAGYFRDTVDFDPGAGIENLYFQGDDPTNADIFILKLNDDGELIWVKSFGGDLDENCFKIELDNEGNIYTTGVYEGTIDLDPGDADALFTALHDHAIFVQKLDTDGNFIWGKSIDAGPGNLSARGIAISDLGEVYLSIWFRVIIDADPDGGEVLTNANGDTDGMIIKLNEDGGYIWDRHLGTVYQDLINQLVLNSAGDVYITGAFIGTMDFGFGVETVERMSNGGNDIYVMKIMSNGDFGWVNTYGSEGKDEGWGITLNSLGEVCVAGVFSNDVDFDESDEEHILESKGNVDAFFLTLTEAGEFQTALSYGGTDLEYAYSVTVDDDDQVYLTGLFLGTTDFNPDPSEIYNLTSGTNTDGYVLKLGGVLSIDASYDNRKLIAYPNPTSGVFNIDFEENETNIDVKIYDLAGKIVLSKFYFDQRLIQLSLENIADGHYYAVVNTENIVATISFVKH